MVGKKMSVWLRTWGMCDETWMVTCSVLVSHLSQVTWNVTWGFTAEWSRFPVPSATSRSPRNLISSGTCYPTPEGGSCAVTVGNPYGTPTVWGPTRDCTLERDPIAALCVEKVTPDLNLIHRYTSVPVWFWRYRVHVTGSLSVKRFSLQVPSVSMY